MHASKKFAVLGVCGLAAWLGGTSVAQAQSSSGRGAILVGAQWDNEGLRAEFHSDDLKRADARNGFRSWSLSTGAAPSAPAGSLVADSNRRTLWAGDSSGGPRQRELSSLIGAQPKSSAFDGLVAAAADLLQPFRQNGDDTVLTLDFGSANVQLQPNKSGQTVPLYIHNTGPAINNLFGLDLKLDITSGSAPKPAFTSVDLRTGVIFSTGNSAQGSELDPTKPQTGFWSVTVNDLNAPATVPGNGATTQIGTITVNTTGVGVGQWLLQVSDPTSLVDIEGNSPLLVYGTANLQVVPEPVQTLALAGIALAGWALSRRQLRFG